MIRLADVLDDGVRRGDLTPARRAELLTMSDDEWREYLRAESEQQERHDFVSRKTPDAGGYTPGHHCTCRCWDCYDAMRRTVRP